MKKIYSKFVKERKKEFQIETSVWQDGDQRFIAKRNLFAEGADHIENMSKTYEMYRDADLVCPSWRQDGMIFFSYMDGVTMEDELLAAVQEKDHDRMTALAETYGQLLDSMCRESNQTSRPGQLTGYTDIIFDVTFDNLMKTDKYRMIDYEWRFGEAVPKEFIAYRAVFAFVMKHGNQLMSMYETMQEFYALFGVSSDQMEVFEEGNNRFVEYVYGREGYQKITEVYKKKTYDLRSPDAMNRLMSQSEKKQWEDSIFCSLCSTIEKHKELYDDTGKLFSVTAKLREQSGEDYLRSRAFGEELMGLLNNCYEMIEFYKTESAARNDIIIHLNEEAAASHKNAEARISELEETCRMLTEEMNYIKSQKAYQVFLKNKVGQKFD